MGNADEGEVCPLCLEALDITDLACQFCTCGYSMCLWCWHRIREDASKQNLPARCPNCRTVYQKDRVRMDSIDPGQLEDTRKKKREERKRAAVAQPKTRKDLANVRVVQRNLVYAVGLAMEICYEDTLMGPEYFGAFGKMVKQMSVNRSGPYGASASRNGPTGSAYITFKRQEDATKCIEAVNGVIWGGKQVKACFGTTKYCNAFLKGVVCNNPECLYLHDIAQDTDSYTKEETKSSKFINLTHAASMTKQPSQGPLAGPPPPPPPGAPSRLQAAASGTLPRQFSSSQISESGSGFNPAADGWDTAGPPWVGSPSNPSWLAKAASSHVQPASSSPPSLPVPPSADDQEWPELGVGTSATQQAAPTSHQQPAPSQEPASHSAQSSGQLSGNNDSQSYAAGLGFSRAASRSASQSAGISPATSSTNSPEQRLSNTPPSSTAYSHQSVTATPDIASASPAFAPHAVKQQTQQQQHQLPDTFDSQRQMQRAIAGSAQAQPLAAVAQQAQTSSAPGPSQQASLAQGQLPAASMSAVQNDPVVQLVSRRASGRVAPPGFSGPVAAPAANAGPQPSTARQKGPPPGFGGPSTSSTTTVNGGATPGFPSQSSSDGSASSLHDPQAQPWPPRQWSQFSQSHSDPNAAASTQGTQGLQQSQSAGSAGYQSHSNAFGLPGLSGLRDQPGSQHSLFSNTAGFAPQTQFRQRSRFHFAGQEAGLNSNELGNIPSPSLFSAGLSTGPDQVNQQQQGNGQTQHQRHHSDHQLFPSYSGGVAPASLFGGSLGMSSSSSVPQLSMHSVPGAQAQASTAAAAALMGHTGPATQDIAPGQALLRQLQMSRSLSSPQGLNNGYVWPEGQNAAAPASGWDVYPAQSSSPFFDPAIVNPSSAALREADLGSSTAAPVQMPVPPALAPPQPTAASPARPANGHTATDKAAENDSDAQVSTPELQTPPKNGKRRRGGRGTKGGAAHRSPQNRGRGRGSNAGTSSPGSSDMVLLQQQYDQAKSQLAISGAQLAHAQQKFQNIRISS